MVDNTRVNELQEKLLQAMDIVNAQALSHMSFDQTIVCTIKEDTYKKEGRYTVTDTSKIFEAYSNDTTFRVEDQVYVTIPQGDFNNQKIIIGKKSDVANKPFLYTNPLDSMFDMTGNILSEGEEAVSGSLIANALDKYSNSQNNQYITLFNKSCDYYGFTHIGLRAKFKSWIKEAVRGEYGLAVILTTNTPNTASNNTINQTQDYYYTLSNYDMYGNPYNFETNYEQQLVIPIEQIKGTITNIKINFYQEANFFDKYNEPIECSQKGFKLQTDTNMYELDAEGDYQLSENDTLLDPNIFVSDIGLYLGYDMAHFTQDMVELYTQDSITYKHSNKANDVSINNAKVLKLRWVHVENGQPIDMVKAIEKGEKNIQYEIRWYRYKVGAVADDAYSGVYWTRIKEATDFTYTFNPDINLQQEKIKVIIIYNSNIPYRSNELILENEQTVPLSNEAHYIQNALTIQADDKTNGNYLIYGQDNSIKDTEYGKETRTLSAWLDVNNNGKIEDTEQVTITSNAILVWRFPANNTMIELLDIQKEEITDSSGNIFYQVITQNPQYKIASYYSPNKTNNTVTCEYTINGRVYTTTKDFTFGVAGTMGSDQTLIIDFLGDKSFAQANHYDINAFQIQLYNNQNIQQAIPDGEVTWAWYYNSDLAEQGKTFPYVIVETEAGKEEVHEVIIQTNDGLENAPMREEKVEIKTFIEGAKNSILTFNNQLFDINGLYILQATVGKLTTYFPIPVSNGSYSHITGPTQVIYQSNGEPAYNRDEYKLYTTNSGVLGVSWSLVASEEIYTYKYLGKITEEQYNKYDACYEVETEGTETTARIYRQSKSYNSNTEYYQRIDNGYCATIKNNRLQPLSIYVKDAPIYGVQAKINSAVVWTQPILVLQNLWPNGVINQWDGKSLVLNEETSTILSSAISAGKKNSDNTFSGVMMGDWGDQDVAGDISKQTGIYGFHHGAMSYAFKEDGTAFIGKSSMARINFNGTDATIYSSGYQQKGNAGMMIDLYGDNRKPAIYLKSANGNSTMQLSTQDKGSLIEMKRDAEQFIKITNAEDMKPLTIGNKFNVDWNGDIDATGGMIGGWNISETQLSSDDGYIVLDTENYGSIILKSTQSKISGGTITGSTIQAGILASTGKNDVGRIALKGYFQVYSDDGDSTMGRLGYIKANTGNAIVDRYSDGIGIYYGTDTNPYSVVKATNANAGLSYSINYISLTSSGISIGNGGGSGVFDLTGFPANKQKGIYARFA